ncbi:hypothetical protein GmHk_06G016357 [Glycine max]|nr:hypothetical protein GmHk_06G016357 [Glycine max]
MKIEQHPPQQSLSVVASMHDEELQPPPQSYEFTPQQHHHQDYEYNLNFFSASREDFMSNIIGTNLRTSKSAYAYIDPKVIIISEDMLFDALRKIFFYANKGCKILLDLFYRQPIYVSDGCVKYDCMELKHDDDVGKMFFIYSKFSTKSLIKFNATFGHSRDEIFALVHKPRNPRTIIEIITLMCDESIFSTLIVLVLEDYDV